jgi:hypothetical protein
MKHLSRAVVALRGRRLVVALAAPSFPGLEPSRFSKGGAVRNIYGPSLGAVACLLVALVGCGGSGNPGGHPSAAAASSPSAQAVRVVALGDSDATGTGDLSCPAVSGLANLRLSYAAAVISRYSSMASCGVRYPSAE